MAFIITDRASGFRSVIATTIIDAAALNAAIVMPGLAEQLGADNVLGRIGRRRTGHGRHPGRLLEKTRSAPASRRSQDTP